MASVIDICNLALAHLGDSAQVISITPPDGTVQSAQCARFYPIARDIVLSAFDWTFATKRKAIAEVTNPAPDDWRYAYALPTTCLRPLAALYPGMPWRDFGAGSDTGTYPFVIEAADDGKPVMYTNLQTAVLRYIDSVSDTTRFPPLVVVAIARLLASYLAGPILKGETGIKVSINHLKIFAELELPKACAADTKMGKRDLSQYRAPWIEARGYQLYTRLPPTEDPTIFGPTPAVPIPGPAPAPSPTPPAPSPAPAPAPSAPPTIAIADEPTYILQVGDYFEHENVWGATGLTRGVYTGLGGTTYESQSGVLYPTNGHGPVAARWRWAFPTGTTEVKSYPSVIAGNMPGWFNTGAGPGGIPIRVENGTISTATPSGPTPNSFFPIALPVAGILTSNFAYALNGTPTGLWHLAYDIWAQDSGPQVNGFTVPPITHEIMIVCTYGGGYGSYPGRNPSWYWGDATVDGILWHIYYAPGFNGAWQFIVFEPDTPTSVPATGHRFDIAAFLNFCNARGWIAAPNPISGNPGTHVVSVQLGVEAVEGTGDLTLYDFDVKNT